MNKPSIRGSLNWTHLWKKGEAIMWLIGNLCVLRNDICRYPREGLCQLGWEWVLESQLIVEESTQLGLRPSVGQPFITPRPKSRSAKWALKITRRAIVKRSYRSIWQSLFVSLFPFVSLTYHKRFNPFREKVWELYFYNEVLISFFMSIQYTHVEAFLLYLRKIK